MAVKSKTALNTDIDTQITTNGNNEITGADLNTILGDMVDSCEDFVGSYTTVQIAALVGMTLRQRVFNTTDNDYEWYDGTRWVKEAHPKYKVYTAILTQTSTNAPVATVLENTLGGTVVWSYNSVGFYTATLVSAFTTNKTQVFMSNAVRSALTGILATQHAFASEDAINFENRNDGVDTEWSALALPIEIEIRVYY